MSKTLLFALIIPGLLLSAAPQAQAAPKTARGKAVEIEELPPINWKLASMGFKQVFKHRNEEIESAEPGRFFPGAVAFALGRMDESGHFLKLSCGAAQNCASQRDELEERVVFTAFLDSIQTPKAPKSSLYDTRTWALTGLGDSYMKKLHKRHPDLFKRLGRLMASVIGAP
ncbi:MAG: hypothetical protein HY952_11630 [Elusimicrobia bacterium]|nr:hypothetical protein [Elusimicrobiota bacterium]